jgi:hypothetical protein
MQQRILVVALVLDFSDCQGENCEKEEETRKRDNRNRSCMTPTTGKYIYIIASFCTWSTDVVLSLSLSLSLSHFCSMKPLIGISATYNQEMRGR